jgi:prophage DNA circulation protein
MCANHFLSRVIAPLSLIQDTVNAIVDALTGGTGSVHIPLAFQKSILKDVINVTGLTLSGLDTFSEVLGRVV